MALVLDTLHGLAAMVPGGTYVKENANAWGEAETTDGESGMSSPSESEVSKTPDAALWGRSFIPGNQAHFCAYVGQPSPTLTLPPGLSASDFFENTQALPRTRAPAEVLNLMAKNGATPYAVPLSLWPTGTLRKLIAEPMKVELPMEALACDWPQTPPGLPAKTVCRLGAPQQAATYSTAAPLRMQAETFVPGQPAFRGIPQAR